MYSSKNAQQMKTVVETYIVEETQDLIYDNEKLAQWNKHIEELGLAGQKTLVQADKSPIPFLFMNHRLVSIFSTLCPTKVEVEKFEASPIPVEILALVALSKQENYFKKIQVWYDDETPDPAIIGLVKGSGTNEYSANYWKYYLIGRWADVKATFEELAVKAKARYIGNTIASAKSSIAFYQRQIDEVEETASREFGI